MKTNPEALRYELRKLFKEYTIAASAGLNATRPRTVDDAEEALQAVITLTENLLAQAIREARIEEVQWFLDELWSDALEPDKFYSKLVNRIKQLQSKEGE